MRYKVSEIAAILGVSVDTIYRSYLPAGAPAQKDAKGNIWIVGTEFAAWAKAFLANRAVRAPMGDDQVFCTTCQEVREIIDRRLMEADAHGVRRLTGRCGTCGGRVNRYVRKEQGAT